MKIVLAYSSKKGLKREYLRRFPERKGALDDSYFAEGDTPETIRAVTEAIASAGNEVVPIEGDAGFEAKLRRAKPDLVYNIAEGLFGDCRESYVPTVCEKLSIPYTGSDPLTLGICLNKGRTKEVLTANRIPNPPFKVFHPGETIDVSGFAFPAIVKPVAEGSSKGVTEKSVVDNAAEAVAAVSSVLEKYEEPAILEGFLPGREFTVACLGNGAGLQVLPIVGFDFTQLPPESRRIYSYEAKWVWDRPENPLKIFQCPAPMAPELRKAIESLAREVIRVLSIRDWCRMDIRLDAAGKPSVIEVNPIPGILPDPRDNSCFPEAARAAGYTYPQLFEKVIDAAVKRIARDRSTSHHE